MSHSEDIRTKAIEYVVCGGRVKDALELFNISNSSFWRWRRMQIETGHVGRKPRPEGSYKFNNDELKAYIKSNPDSYLIEVAEHFKVTISCESKALKRLKITRKKKACSMLKETKKSVKNS